MIDYFFRWTTEADAKQDALMLADYLHVSSSGLRDWARDRVLPDVKVWRPSQDIISSGAVVHSYLAGWSAIVALAQPRDILTNASALAFALNREGPPYVIKNNIGAIISDVACEPIFAGSHYPIGGYSS